MVVFLAKEGAKDMSTRTYTRPYVVTEKGAKQIESALKGHPTSTRAYVGHLMTPQEVIAKYKRGKAQ